MNTHAKILCTLLVLAVVNLPAQVVPEYVNYQGLLKAADGSSLATGNYTIEFNIYDDASAGTLVWGPFLFDGTVGAGHGLQVPVVNGRFNVIIGPTDADGDSITGAFDGPERFIEIKVGGGNPILPRQQFLSTAYAMHSRIADKIGDDSVTTDNILNHSILAEDLADDAVTTEKILNDSVTADDLAANSVSSEEIADGQVTANDLGDGTLTHDEPLELRIVRGVVDISNETATEVIGGDQYDVTRVGEGKWAITFTSPFAGRPVVTANSYYPDGHSTTPRDNYIVVREFTAGSCELWSMDDSESGGADPQDDGGFTFIAIGPR